MLVCVCVEETRGENGRKSERGAYIIMCYNEAHSINSWAKVSWSDFDGQTFIRRAAIVALGVYGEAHGRAAAPRFQVLIRGMKHLIPLPSI